MKKDKYYDGYMTGKCSALDLVKEEGIEALERDIKLRKAYPVPHTISAKEYDEIIRVLGQGSKNTIFALIYIILHEDFGFGLERMNKFYDGFERRYNDILEVSVFGNRYVSLLDYAHIMKEKYPDLRIDLDRIAVEEDSYMSHVEIDTKLVDYIINLLDEQNYHDAAHYLKSRKFDYKQ